MIEPVVAPTPTGTVGVFLDGLQEGTEFMPVIWVALVFGVLAAHYVAKMSVLELMDRRKLRKQRRANT